MTDSYKAKYSAFEVECPVCHADKGEHCMSVALDNHNGIIEVGDYRAPHVERGRLARWAIMYAGAIGG